MVKQQGFFRNVMYVFRTHIEPNRTEPKTQHIRTELEPNSYFL